MRIVSLLPSATDIIFELGLLDTVVGVSGDCNWPPELAGTPVVAQAAFDPAALSSAEIDALVSASASDGQRLFAIDADVLDQLAPDLVITQDLCSVCAVSSDDVTIACPLDVDIVSMNPTTLDDVVASVVDLAERLGAPDAGREVAGRMQLAIEGVRAATAGLPRPRVFIAEWIDPPYTAGHWVPDMVHAAGGVNLLSAAGDRSVATSWDAVLAHEPDLIVIAACGFSLEEAGERVGDLRLPVRTVVVDGDAHFSRPAPRLADGVRQLGHLLHPHAVPDPGLPWQELGTG
jgi:iron complex transport system substrate-binding protein